MASRHVKGIGAVGEGGPKTVKEIHYAMAGQAFTVMHDAIFRPVMRNFGNGFPLDIHHIDCAVRRTRVKPSVLVF
jgi:hypothetical protein